MSARPLSTRRGNAAKKGPAHKNKFAFKHNKHSRKTKFIAALPTGREQGSGLCVRCQQIIEWRKQYRKYKPMREAHKCAVCTERKVTLAYHVICHDCARKLHVCPKCRHKPEAVASEDPNELREEDVLEAVSSASLKQRQRRTIMRRFEQGTLTARSLQALLNGEHVKDDDDDDEDDDGGEGDGSDEEDDDDDDDKEKEAEPEPEPEDAAVLTAKEALKTAAHAITHEIDWTCFDDDYDEAKHNAILHARMAPFHAALAQARAAAAATASASSAAAGAAAASAAGAAPKASSSSAAAAAAAAKQPTAKKSAAAEPEDDGEGEDDDGEGDGDGDEGEGDDDDGEGDAADDDDGEGDDDDGEGDDGEGDEDDDGEGEADGDDGDDAEDGKSAPASAAAAGGKQKPRVMEPTIDGARLSAAHQNKLVRGTEALRAMNAVAKQDKKRGKMLFGDSHTHAAMKAKAKK